MIEIPLTEGEGWSPAQRLTSGQAAAALATEDIQSRPRGAAARELRKLPGLRDDVLGMLSFVERRLSNVGSMRQGETWLPTRLNTHYYRALSLAGLVLRGNSYELDGDSGVRADGLLISMSHLFQDFIAKALDSALHRYGGDCRSRQEHHPVLAGEPEILCYTSGQQAPDRRSARAGATAITFVGAGTAT